MRRPELGCRRLLSCAAVVLAAGDSYSSRPVVGYSGYVAMVPALPRCHTQGESPDETERNVKEAIALYLESLAAHGETIPEEGRSFQGPRPRLHGR